MSEFWSVPRAWPGAMVVCIAGGPSLNLADLRQVALARLAGACRAITVNDAYIPAFWADALYAADWRWWKKHAGAPGFAGVKVTIQNAQAQVAHWPEIRVLKNAGAPGLEDDPSGIRTGQNSGYSAINLAVHFGAKRIVLLGYDMKADRQGRTHWFGDHEDWKSNARTIENWQKFYGGLAPLLKELGVEVINCSPGTGLDAFPKRALEKVL